MQSVKQTCVAFLIATLLAPGLFLGITPPKQAEAQVADIIGNIVGAGVSYALCEYGEDIREFLGGMLGGVLGGIFGGGNQNPESDDSTQFSVPVNESNVQVKQNIGKTRTTVESDLYKECVLDPVAWILKALLINTVEQDILDWIDNGFEGGPVFLRDPLAFAKALARDAFDEYMEESGIDISLCEPFRASVMQSVYIRGTQSTYGDSGSARCMVNDIINATVNNGSVETDGIVGAMRLAEEGNNPYSSLFNMQADAAQRTSEIVGREMTLASYGDGYHSERCEYNGEWGVCTPGQLISKQVDDWLGGSLGQMENADEAAEVVSQLVANLVLHIFGDSEDGLLGGHELEDDDANAVANEEGYTNPIDPGDDGGDGSWFTGTTCYATAPETVTAADVVSWGLGRALSPINPSPATYTEIPGLSITMGGGLVSHLYPNGAPYVNIHGQTGAEKCANALEETVDVGVYMLSKRADGWHAVLWDWGTTCSGNVLKNMRVHPNMSDCYFGFMLATPPTLSPQYRSNIVITQWTM